MLPLVFTEEYTDGGILARTCEGDVGVAKCEGSCNSQVQPSVVHPSGFLKVCIYLFTWYSTNV